MLLWSQLFNILGWRHHTFKIAKQEIASGYEVVSHAELKDHHVYRIYKHSNERLIVTRMNILAGVWL